jgi:hypothetical protein
MIEIEIKKEFTPSQLQKEVLSEFANTISDWGMETRGTKLLVDIPNTLENRNRLKTLINNHDYTIGQREQKLKSLRKEREKYFDVTDKKFIKYLQQKEMENRGIKENTDLTEKQFEELLIDAQDLRDLPATCRDLNNPKWPFKLE